MTLYLVVAAVACAVTALADENLAEAPHKSIIRRKESHKDAGAMTLTISDGGGIRGSRGSEEASIATDTEATRRSRQRRQELEEIFSTASGHLRQVTKSEAFLNADHEVFHGTVEGERKLSELAMSVYRKGTANRDWEGSSFAEQRISQRQKKEEPEEEEKEKEKEEEKKEEEGEKATYCKWENKTCLPNLDYEYGPMDDPLLFNSYADAQACWKHNYTEVCRGPGCAWRDDQCHYAVPNTTGHAMMVKYMPSNDCGWFAKLERPRKCQTFKVADCPEEMEPCMKSIMYKHDAIADTCATADICDADMTKMTDMLCEEPLVDIYVACFTEASQGGHTGTELEAKQIECVRKKCVDYADMLEFYSTAGRLCPRYNSEVESCERQGNCSYAEEGSLCVPDPSHMMLDKIPKSCRYHDTFKKAKKCKTTMQSLCTDDACEWTESSPCTGNDTVPQFECDVKSNVYLKTVIDNTDDEHLLTYVQAVTAKEVCLAATHEDSCKRATPMQRGGENENAAWRSTGALIYGMVVIASFHLGAFTSCF